MNNNPVLEEELDERHYQLDDFFIPDEALERLQNGGIQPEDFQRNIAAIEINNPNYQILIKIRDILTEITPSASFLKYHNHRIRFDRTDFADINLVEENLERNPQHFRNLEIVQPILNRFIENYDSLKLYNKISDFNGNFEIAVSHMYNEIMENYYDNLNINIINMFQFKVFFAKMLNYIFYELFLQYLIYQNEIFKNAIDEPELQNAVIANFQMLLFNTDFQAYTILSPIDGYWNENYKSIMIRFIFKGFRDDVYNVFIDKIVGNKYDNHSKTLVLRTIQNQFLKNCVKYDSPELFEYFINEYCSKNDDDVRFIDLSKIYIEDIVFKIMDLEVFDDFFPILIDTFSDDDRENFETVVIDPYYNFIQNTIYDEDVDTNVAAQNQVNILKNAIRNAGLDVNIDE